MKATLYHTAAGLAPVAFDEVDGWDTDKWVEGRDCLWKGPCREEQSCGSDVMCEGGL